MSSPSIFSQLSEVDAQAVILEAAIRLAAKVGDAQLRIEDVAESIGCTPEQVREHFATEAAILESIPDYFRRRLAAYMTEPESTLDSINTAGERLASYGETYVDYLNKDPELFQYLFEMRSSLEPGQIEEAIAGTRGINISFTTLLESIRAVAEESGNPNPSRESLVYSGLAAWATVHGMAHLSLLGVLRHQHAAVRRYNYRTILESFVDSLRRKYAEDFNPEPSPLLPVLRPVAEAHTAARTYHAGETATPDMSESRLRTIAMDTALEIIGTDGIDALTLRRLATEMSLPLDVLYQLVDNEFELRERAELQTDLELAQGFDAVFSELPQDAAAVDRLRAMAVAYFQHALSNPRRYNAMIALGSKSVVPNSTLDHEVEMGEAFKVLQSLCQQTLVEMGQTPTDQQVYIKTLILWSGANGACHLLTLGDLRDIPLEQKWDILAYVVEYVVYMFRHDLSQ